MRIATLGTIIEEARSISGLASSASDGETNVDNRLRNFAKLAQRFIFTEYRFPVFRVEEEVALVIGQDSYDLPATLSHESIDTVYVKINSNYFALVQGVNFNDYNAFDLDENYSYPLAWWPNLSGETQKITLWPVPADDGFLKLSGQKALGVFEADTDNCSIDADILVYWVADELMRSISKDYNGSYGLLAQGKIRSLVSKTTSSKGFNFAGNDRVIVPLSERIISRTPRS